jgi:hypothetical protein
MKTTKLTLTTTIALALALGVWSIQAAEKGSARGGATDLIQQIVPQSATVPAPLMACANCKSEYVTRTDVGARGIAKPTYVVERHLCGTCSTEIKTVGTGKQARDVAAHLCKACTK